MSIAYNLLNQARGYVAESIWYRMIRYNGGLRSSRHLPARLKQSFANRYAVQERAEIALTVAGMYPGGDYFEFGCDIFRSFKNFLTAFDLNDLQTAFPATKFFAFDVFGDLNSGAGIPDGEEWYFEKYRGDEHYREAQRQLQSFTSLYDRCEFVKGYFADTLNESFKARLRGEERSIGFAFLDCNIASSYQTCFDFIGEFLRTDRSFIFMDEYFQMPEVPAMFDQLCARLHERHGLRAHYVRNAGAFGALFCLMRELPGDLERQPI